MVCIFSPLEWKRERKEEKKSGTKEISKIGDMKDEKDLGNKVREDERKEAEKGGKKKRRGKKR